MNHDDVACSRETRDDSETACETRTNIHVVQNQHEILTATRCSHRTRDTGLGPHEAAREETKAASLWLLCGRSLESEWRWNRSQQLWQQLCNDDRARVGNELRRVRRAARPHALAMHREDSAKMALEGLGGTFPSVFREAVGPMRNPETKFCLLLLIKMGLFLELTACRPTCGQHRGRRRRRRRQDGACSLHTRHLVVDGGVGVVVLRSGIPPSSTFSVGVADKSVLLKLRLLPLGDGSRAVLGAP